MIKLISFLFILLSFISCNRPDVKVNLLTNNSKEIQFQLEKGDVVNLYSNIDIEYKEKPLFVYHCQFYFEDSLLFEGGTDPLVIKDTLLIENSLGVLKLYGKLDGNLTASKQGLYSIKTTFVKNKSIDLKINKAEIVFVR
jgi:hypothetical protein